MILLDYFIEYRRYLSVFGIVAIIALAMLFSKKRKAINTNTIINGLVLQFFLAFLIKFVPFVSSFVQLIADAVVYLYTIADEGLVFLFGNLVKEGPWGFVFAFKVLPVIIFFGALMSVAEYYGLVRRLVSGISKYAAYFLHTSGPETLCAFANSMLGQTEAPLLIKSYLTSLSPSELGVVMISGMSTISAAILGVYAALGIPAYHLIVSSVISIPAAIVIAKILIPQPKMVSSELKTLDKVTVTTAENVIDAFSGGARDGLNLALNIGGMLLAFLAAIALINSLLFYGFSSINILLSLVGISAKVPAYSLENILSFLTYPFVWLLGLQGEELHIGAQVLGLKVAVNEMVAYLALAGSAVSARALMVLTYALCGFSNISCIGIQIGGIGALAPNQRSLLAEYGLYAVLGGFLANMLTACVAAIIW